MGGMLGSGLKRSLSVNRKLLREGRVNKRTLAQLLDETEPIRLSLDDQNFVFLDGVWLPDFSAKDYRKLSKQNQFLVAENSLLKVKVDILLELIAGRNTEKPKKLLTHRRNSVIKSIQGYSVDAIPSNIDFQMHEKKPELKCKMNAGDLEGILFSIGDPLLDIVAEVPVSFLHKYRLDPDSGTLMGNSHSGLVEELLGGSFELTYVPGGSEQNCLKVVQRLVGVPHATTYLGCIGRDKNGQILESAMKEFGINTRYRYVDDQPTGLCYICLTGVKRSLVTQLGAAQSPVLDLLKEPENWKLVEKARYFYVEAYSVVHRFDEMMLIVEHALKHNKTFAMNLSSPYLCSKFKDKIHEALPYVDLLFGSELEALAFGAASGFDTNQIDEIALCLARTPKANGRRGRLVMLTRGKNPAVAVSDGQVRHFPVIPTPAEDIQDTVGAGDSFTGGYLAALVTGHKHDDCMHAALEAAHYVLRLRGCEILSNFNETLGLHLAPEKSGSALPSREPSVIGAEQSGKPKA